VKWPILEVAAKCRLGEEKHLKSIGSSSSITEREYGIKNVLHIATFNFTKNEKVEK
jgi:hypothetical protein